MTKELISKAVISGRTALEAVNDAIKKTDSAENLSAAAGLIGTFIRSSSQKKANKAVDAASQAVNEFNDILAQLGSSDDITLPAGAEERLDNVLFTTAESSLLANNTAIRARMGEVKKLIEEAVKKLEGMGKE